jgi:protein-disulfide isomerase
MTDNPSQPTYTEEQSQSKTRQSNGITQFGLGVILGAVITAIAMTLASGTNRQVMPDTTVIRNAAWQGASEAIAAEATRSATNLAKTAETQDAEPQPLTNQTAEPSPNLIGPEQQPTPLTLSIREANMRGKLDAAVTIVEFGDFGCYYCTNFYDNTLHKLLDKYVNSGQVRFVYKHLPITSLHPGADTAALASECAADQGKFWEFHNVLFSHNREGFDKDLMVQHAKDLKLDLPKFSACLDAPSTMQRVQVDMDQATSLGLRGTPSFLINGRQVIGAQPYEVFVQVIEEALKKN